MIDPQGFPVDRRETVQLAARVINGIEPGIDGWAFVPVEMLKIYLETSIRAGTKWAVFEPNDEPLWAELTSHVSDFMQRLFVQGAFQGEKPEEAYFVKCDAQINTALGADAGIVKIEVGFAPLHPAEFVVIQIGQWLSPCVSGDC